jgi:beta-galactosidase
LILTTGLPHARAFERQSWWTGAPMVAVVRKVAVVRPAAIDPGYANATTLNQAAEPAAPVPGAQRPPRPQAAPAAQRFSEPLLSDWTPKDLTPHTENLEVYTNAEEVELFLNGRSLGTQKLHADASPITYAVPFEPGTLKAVARTKGKVVATQELKTAGKPARLVFTADAPAKSLTPEWNDVRYLTATLVDDAGTPILDSTTVVHFAATGPAAIVGVDNGNMADHESFVGTERRLYEGNAIAIVRATAGSGAITVTATADGVPAAQVKLSAGPVTEEDPAVVQAVGGKSF